MSGEYLAGTSRPQDVTNLVLAARDGDESAWNLLVERFSGLVWSVCRSFRLNRADAADVVQMVWLRLLEHLDSLREPERLAGWLATTSRHECHAQLRRRARLQLTDDDRVFDRGAGPQGGADRDVLIADRDATLWEAFDRLGRRCREILRVLVVEPEARPSYSVAAEALGIPVGSLGPTRARCLEQLRKLLDPASIRG
jgi:RNA polymerase sigma factor (sigma-70 family)